MIQEKFVGLRNILNNNPENASDLIDSIEMDTAEAIVRRDYEQLTIIRNHLQAEFSGVCPSDLNSYLLGKAHSLAEVIHFHHIPYETKQEAKKLSPQTYKIMNIIRDKVDITPSQIADSLGISHQNTVNYLIKLRANDYVRVMHTGKNSWYSLTGIGEAVLAERDSLEIPNSNLDNYLLSAKEREIEDLKKEIENLNKTIEKEKQAFMDIYNKCLSDLESDNQTAISDSKKIISKYSIYADRIIESYHDESNIENNGNNQTSIGSYTDTVHSPYVQKRKSNF